MDTQCTWITLLTGLPEYVYGAEDPPEGTGNDSSNSSGEPKEKPEGNADGSEGENPDDDEEDDNSDLDEKDLAGLKSAIAKERAAAKQALKDKKAAEKEAKTLREAKEAEELEKGDKVVKAETKLTKAEDKLKKLSEGFLTSSINTAIRKAAEKADFVDPDDAIEGIALKDLTYEQDDDDPSKVDIDLKSVEKAVKALATKKPHFLKQGTSDGQPTGGQFGGSQQKKPSSEDALRKLYPALAPSPASPQNN